MVVGASSADLGGSDRGLVLVLRLRTNGTVAHQVTLGSGVGGLPVSEISNGDEFGSALEGGLGDVNADGLNDIAVGLPGANDLGNDRGAILIVFLSENDTAKGFSRLSQANSLGLDVIVPKVSSIGMSLAATSPRGPI